MKDMINCIMGKGLPKRDLKNSMRANVWAILWTLSLGMFTYLTTVEWFNTATAIMCFIVNLAVGIKLVLSYKYFLIYLDEMERKIQLDALALSVGVTIVSFASLSILARGGIIGEAKTFHLIMILSLSYMIGIVVGRVKYK
ncbi:hypothetical protein ACM9HF_05245 [Colwellia sp. RE-S-Sl-9]